jgi:aspartate aminotransferase-like enzyme
VPSQNLRIPGPTPLPDAIREAGTRQMINHRGPEFKELLYRLSRDLRTPFGTSSEILILTASGTGGLEAGVVTFLSPGDRVLSVSIGVFGDRLASIASTYGADVAKPAIEWGRAADPELVREELQAMRAAGGQPQAVLLTFNETSTGVTNPLAELAGVVREEAPDALLIVDAISGLGAMPFDMEDWGLDVVVTGSQKSWMIPPGLAMAAVSDRAWAAAGRATMPRFYLDLVRHRDSLAKGQTPWTPAVGLCFQLDVALELIAAEGYERIFARHAACGAATRAGLSAMGFRLFADPAHASNTVTSAHLPPDVEWSPFSAALRERGLVLAGGQGSLAGRIFRVGHLGDVKVDDILSALAVIEEVAPSLGIAIETGVAQSAAREAAEGASGRSGELATSMATSA